MAVELANIEVRLDADLAARIEALAEQCGLTRDQMASALVVLSYHHLIVQSAPIEAELELCPECGSETGHSHKCSYAEEAR